MDRPEHSPTRLTGIVGSKGVCTGRAYVFKRRIEVKKVFVPPEQIDRELERLEHAIELTRRDILAAQKEALDKHGAKYAAIFESHLLMLTDPQFKPQMVRKLKAEKVNVESIVRETVDALHAAFALIPDPYLRERAIDIKDVGDRILRHLMGLEGPLKEIGNEPFILIAAEITPSELLEFAKGRLEGICLDSGGATSHVAILANALGIPSVFGLGDLSRVARTGDLIHLDTRQEGLVILHPDLTVTAGATTSPTAPAGGPDLPQSHVTADGVPLRLGVNIARVEELPCLERLQIDRIGLFRSEFLFMESIDLPSEAFQENIYRQVTAAGRAMTVLRTIDIGSDKPVKYIPFPHEANPAMGFRSIRFALSRPDLLLPHVRAMVRAGAHSPTRIIFPMVSTPAELDGIDALFQRALDEVQPAQAPEWGIMVEVPSAIFMMEQIARRTRYISLGTNDLLQFFYAMDRTNERLNAHAHPLCLPFLRLLFYGVSVAKGEGITVGICGEMASDPAGFLTLLGIGLEEFSLRPGAVVPIRRLIPRLERRAVVSFVQQHLADGDLTDLRPAILEAFPAVRESNG
ncbi:MAG: Phosphoenolpyruvate-protein phosphotransferase of PTS system (PtsA) [Candidatus Ozemobacter sibiricus]|uniref:Phosphoenolpyruvate-protein phosphotransferase n=1 Tax=Candidatus Ozemobacter sibiricus TaxID=2268124 RepID=A0A367ZSV7_9BACT|nr:MAG: Phosphoenolpyruvate-protein phosphotransferase of PTS system (PtsA) [Candidatus Ozemobacter sibiricus]